MCGLVFALDRTGGSVNQQVWDQYEKQKSRGTEGFGVFNGKYTVKAAMEKRIKRWMVKERNNSNMLMFHHRFPTSTINVKKAAHPFNTGNYFGDTRYVLVHNGVIRNAKSLRPEHEKLGIKYQSILQDEKFNDSEVLLWDMALTLEGKQDDLKAYGDIAFICIKLVNNEVEKMYFGRNMRRPLNLLRNKNGILLSSEGEGESIEPALLYTYNYKLNRLTNKYFRIPMYDPSYKSSWSTSTYNSNRSTAPRLPSSSSDNYCGYGQYGYRSSSRDFLEYDDGDYDYQDNYMSEDIDSYFDDNGNYIPESERLSRTLYRTTSTVIADVLNQKFKPTERQIQAKVFELLGESNGSYYNAYWASTGYYSMLEEEPMQTAQDRFEMKILSEAGDIILADPNYIDNTSIHPMWVAADETPTIDSSQTALMYGGA